MKKGHGKKEFSKKNLQKENAVAFKESMRNDEIKESKAEDIKEKLNLGSDILDKFNQEFGTNEPVRALFDEKNIKLKTEVTQEQRNIIAILYSAYMRCEQMGLNFSALKDVLDQFVVFGASVERKSREEFVDAVRGQAPQFPFGFMGNNQQQGNNLQQNLKV